MKIDKEIIKELIDYTWSIEEQLRGELLENFNKLANHKSETDKIRDKLIDIELSLNRDVLVGLDANVSLPALEETKNIISIEKEV